MNPSIDRRGFLRTTAVTTGGLAAGLGGNFLARADDAAAVSKTRSYNADMDYRRLGNTGLWVSAVCLGGHWKRVPDVIGEHLRPWIEAWLDSQGLALRDVSSWAVHPGGPRILGAVEEALDLSREATADSRAVLERFGNMSSPTVLFILDRLRRAHAPRPCVALGFGPGLTAEAALFL